MLAIAVRRHIPQMQWIVTILECSYIQMGEKIQILRLFYLQFKQLTFQ